MIFSDLREANVKRQKEWSGSDKASLEFRALEVGGETGELLEAVKKYIRQRDGIRGTKATMKNIADEIGDVIISLDLLADCLGLDLAACAKIKFNKTSGKYKLKTRL